MRGKTDIEKMGMGEAIVANFQADEDDFFPTRVTVGSKRTIIWYLLRFGRTY